MAKIVSSGRPMTEEELDIYFELTRVTLDRLTSARVRNKCSHPENCLMVISGGDDIGKVRCTLCDDVFLPTKLFA